MGSGAVGIDIERLSSFETRLFKSLCYSPGCRFSVRRGSSYVICIAGVAVAADFSQYLCTPEPCVFIFLKHQRTGSLAHHESLSAGIERQAGLERVFLQ